MTKGKGFREHFNPEELRKRLNSEQIVERIGRRELLTGLGLAGFGSLTVPIPWKVDEKLSGGERRLRKLAATVDDADLTDPQQVGSIQTEVEAGINSVKEVLHDDGVNDGQEVAALRKDLHETAGVLPLIAEHESQSSTARQMSMLEGALKYYSALSQALGRSISLRNQLRASERVVLYHDGTPSHISREQFDIDSFATATEQLPTGNNRGGQTSIQRSLKRLLPDRRMASEELLEQQEVFRSYIEAQQAYLDTGERVETGALYHELVDLGEARKAFNQALEATEVKISEEHQDYALSEFGLSLGQYHRLFAIRREGIAKLIAACDSSVTDADRQNSFNEGLDHLFRARRIVTDRA